MGELIFVIILSAALIALYVHEQNQICKVQDEAAQAIAKAAFAEEYKEKYRIKWREALDENEKLEAEIRALKAEIRALKYAESEVKTNE